MLAKKLLNLFESKFEDQLQSCIEELGLSDLVTIDYYEVDEEGSLIVSFVNNETEEDMTIAFSVDEDGSPIALYVDSEDDAGESSYVDLSDLDVPMIDGKIDFETSFEWLDPEVLLDILDGDEEEVEEASVYVIRGGKKVKKKLVRRKRRKPMTANRRQAIRKAVISRRKTKNQANRRRAKSLKLRNRSKLKRSTNKRMRVAY